MEVAGERRAAWLCAVVTWRGELQGTGTRLGRVWRSTVLTASHTPVFFPALQSFIRAYTTYPRELKHVFHVRLLHLGHVAKSFGLRDAPQNLGVSAIKKKKAAPKR